ncbi:Uncharacterised protein [uncultured archaeon]|nr:Uncharacterised protein [uncultured archaeon]
MTWFEMLMQEARKQHMLEEHEEQNSGLEDWF